MTWGWEQYVSCMFHVCFRFLNFLGIFVRIACCLNRGEDCLNRGLHRGRRGTRIRGNLFFCLNRGFHGMRGFSRFWVCVLSVPSKVLFYDLKGLWDVKTQNSVFSVSSVIQTEERARWPRPYEEVVYRCIHVYAYYFVSIADFAEWRGVEFSSPKFVWKDKL